MIAGSGAGVRIARTWRPRAAGAGRATRCRQFRHDDAPAGGAAGGPPVPTTLTGDASLSRRPMRRIIEPLEAMGARIGSHEGAAPLTIDGARLTAIDWHLAGRERAGEERHPAGRPARGRHDARSRTAAHTRPYRACISGLRSVCAATIDGLVCAVDGRSAGASPPPRTLWVPGDPSSAAVWAAAAAALPGSEVRLDGGVPESAAARLRHRPRTDGRRRARRRRPRRPAASRSARFASPRRRTGRRTSRRRKCPG